MDVDMWERSIALLILYTVEDILDIEEPCFQGPDSWFVDTLKVHNFLNRLKVHGSASTETKK